MVIVLLLLFLPIVPVTYTTTVPKQEKVLKPYEVTEQKSRLLLHDKPTVKAGHYIYYRVYIDVSDKKNNVVKGYVEETAGYDINFYVFDQKGFMAWKSENPATPYVEAKRVKYYEFSFVPDHTDYYYFVLDNGYSWFTNKVPEMEATWYYEVTITKYKEVTETRYVKVNKTKRVSIIELILGG
ncbi:hypothetical protein [Pyrococcus kukulkanii]